MRRLSKRIAIGKTAIGGDTPITVQSMLNVPSDDIQGNVEQARKLERAGCEIIRAAVPDEAAVQLIYRLKETVSIPVVADIHFDYKLAIAAVDAGADKIRINPGNIGDEARIKAVADRCLRAGVPIRIGVNSGSVEKDLLARFGGPTPEALAESALKNARMLEKFDFDNIVLSIKSSDVKNTYDANRIAAEKCDYPLHIGVTEAGTRRMGSIKSAAGIGGLLLAGIGDTIRVSLTGDPVDEVVCAKALLKALGIRTCGVSFVSCPTCGRTRIDLIGLVNRVEEALAECNKNIKVAVMGCVVNGPGEAREADIGIAGGNGCGVIFRKGEIIRKVSENELLEALIQEVNQL